MSFTSFEETADPLKKLINKSVLLTKCHDAYLSDALKEIGAAMCSLDDSDDFGILLDDAAALMRCSKRTSERCLTEYMIEGLDYIIIKRKSKKSKKRYRKTKVTKEIIITNRCFHMFCLIVDSDLEKLVSIMMIRLRNKLFQRIPEEEEEEATGEEEETTGEEEETAGDIRWWW